MARSAFLFLLSVALVEASKVCPHQCLCYDSSDLVDCRGRGFTHVPHNIPHGTWLLDLGGNTLSDLYIHRLEPEAFSSLGFLEKLDLSHNWLRRLVTFRNFEKLENLEKLDLSGNQILSVEPGTFRALSHLRHLYLQDNHLNVLKDGMLAMLQSLETFLNLHTPGTHLQLANNPWICDCDLHRVFSKILSVRHLHVDDYKNITCDKPWQLAGSPLAWVDTQLCIAETATVLVITVTVLVTVVAAIVMAERNLSWFGIAKLASIVCVCVFTLCWTGVLSRNCSCLHNAY
uniref:Si:ch211-237i5.4 n=1 Tax=Erpetoichthys calabaricus TaxID=27687 RepID=A0A8C4SM53_ERPCA